MAKYRKKPAVIEAVRYTGNGNMDGGVPDWIWAAFETKTLKSTHGGDPLVIHTPEGDATVAPGDWIIKGVGRLYLYANDVFLKTYEAVMP